MCLRTQLFETNSGEVIKLKFWCEILLALPCLVAVWFAFWNSDHVVLKSSIRTSASPWWQRSHWGLRVTQDAYFSLLTHTKQLLFVKFCDRLAGIEVIFWTDGRNHEWTDRRGSRNSYLDFKVLWALEMSFLLLKKFMIKRNCSIRMKYSMERYSYCIKYS